MRTALVLLVTALTSLAALLAGARLGLAAFATAIGIVLEVLGATVLFFVANVMLGVTLILTGRLLTLYYTTLYDMTDLVLPLLSLLQALLVTTWKHSRRSPR